MSSSLALAVLLAAALAAEPPEPLDRVLNGPAEPAAIFQARAALKDCSQPTCRAVDDIAQAFEITTRRDLPNTMVHLYRPHGDPEREAEQGLRRLVPAHSDLYPAYCRVLTKMARHYSDWSVGLVVIELGNRIDGTGDRCTREVISAFPLTKDAGDMIAASRNACQAARRGGCRRDQRPSKGA